MKKRVLMGLLCLFALLLMPQEAHAATVEIDVTGIESAHNYANSANEAWTISCPGAERIRLTFDYRTEFEIDYDFLYIFDANGTQVGKYSGTELAKKTITINSDSVQLQLVSDSVLAKWGFKVTSASAEIS